MNNETNPKILFVDDEKNILRTIKRSFLRQPFTIFTADSAEKGFEILETEKIDVVVSDVKMPIMDGIEFLTIVKKKYPEINRIILSGYVEKEYVVNAIITGVSFTYLTKPWMNDELAGKLKHVLNIKTVLQSNSVLSMVNQIKKLPDIPELYEKFLEAIANEASMHEISEIISKDISLTTKILQVINSAFYSIKKTSSIDTAVNLLGLNNLKSIIFSTILLDEKYLNPKEKRELLRISDMSYKVNKVFGKLFEIKYKENLHEDYSSLGLLYNVGKLIMIRDFSDKYFEMISKMKSEKSVDFYEKEIEAGYYGCTHREIGAYFLYLWNFSEIAITAALYQFDTNNLNQEEKKAIDMLRFSDNLIRYFEEDMLAEFFDTNLFIESGFLKEEINKVLES